MSNEVVVGARVRRKVGGGIGTVRNWTGPGNQPPNVVAVDWHKGSDTELHFKHELRVLPPPPDWDKIEEDVASALNAENEARSLTIKLIIQGVEEAMTVEDPVLRFGLLELAGEREHALLGTCDILGPYVAELRDSLGLTDEGLTSEEGERLERMFSSLATDEDSEVYQVDRCKLRRLLAAGIKGKRGKSE